MKKLPIRIIFAFPGLFLFLNTHAQNSCKDKFWPLTHYAVTEHKDITFGHALNYYHENQELQMDIYQPETTEPRPLMIWLYGGGFFAGNKSDVEYQCRDFASRGFVSAAPTYRLGWDVNPQGICESDSIDIYRAMHRAIQDVRATIRFLQFHAAEYHIDTSHIFIGGYSAGAILSLQVPWQQESETESWLRDELGALDSAVNQIPGKINIHASASFAGAVSNKNILLSGEKIPFIAFHGTCDDIVYYGTGAIFSCRKLASFDGPGTLIPIADSLQICHEIHAYCGGTHNLGFTDAVNRDMAFTFFRDKLVCGNCDESKKDGILENNTYPCSEISICQNKSNSEFNFNLFPNPAKDHFTIIPFLTQPALINARLYDRQGRTVHVFDGILARTNEPLIFDLQGQETGLYFLHVSSPAGLSWIKKIALIQY